MESERGPSVREVANLTKQARASQLCMARGGLDKEALGLMWWRRCMQISYNNKQLVGALIVAGWDARHGGQVYCVPIGGTVVQEKWAADGSGSIFLLGYMDSAYRQALASCRSCEKAGRGRQPAHHHSCAAGKT